MLRCSSCFLYIADFASELQESSTHAFVEDNLHPRTLKKATNYATDPKIIIS